MIIQATEDGVRTLLGVEVTKRGWIMFTFLMAEQWFVETVNEGREGEREEPMITKISLSKRWCPKLLIPK